MSKLRGQILPGAASIAGQPSWSGAKQTLSLLERFRAKRAPVRVKKTLQNKRLESRSDSIGTEKAVRFLQWHGAC
jgi:hypothetical protein